MKPFWGLGAVVVLVLNIISTAPAYGAVISVQLDAAQYGTLDQAKTNCPVMGCGPTAATNSLVYLQNAFPKIYRQFLVPTSNERPTEADMIAVANDIGANFMKTDPVGGTLIEDLILGKRDYMESKAPNVTKYRAQLFTEWRENPPDGTHPGTEQPNFVQDNTVPTIDFLVSELRRKQNIEIVVGADAFAHFLTLTGLEFDPVTMTGMLRFIDPFGGEPGMAEITGLEPFGDQFLIRTSYQHMGFARTLFIGHAVSQSPIPEPSTVLLIIGGMAVLVVIHRRTPRKTARSRGHWLIQLAISQRGRAMSGNRASSMWTSGDAALSKASDPLERMNEVLDLEMFRKPLVKASIWRD